MFWPRPFTKNGAPITYATLCWIARVSIRSVSIPSRNRAHRKRPPSGLVHEIPSSAGMYRSRAASIASRFAW